LIVFGCVKDYTWLCISFLRGSIVLMVVGFDWGHRWCFLLIYYIFDITMSLRSRHLINFNVFNHRWFKWTLKLNTVISYGIIKISYDKA
jgi:hypothetical protein